MYFGIYSVIPGAEEGEQPRCDEICYNQGIPTSYKLYITMYFGIYSVIPGAEEGRTAMLWQDIL